MRLIPQGRRAGIVSYSAGAMTPAHLDAVGVAPDTAVAGEVPDGEYGRWIMQGDPDVPFGALQGEVVETARAFAAANPKLGAIVRRGQPAVWRDR